MCISAAYSSNRMILLKGIMNDVHGTVWEGFSFIAGYFNLRKENERLSEDNSVLMEELARLSANPGDSVVWKTCRVNFKMIPAHIVSVNRGSLHNYYIIDRGSEDGVVKSDGVITPTGVIGMVGSVGQKFSYVLSLKNSDLSVSARIGRDGHSGILRWDGIRSDESILSGIPIHIPYNPGDTVFTSGYSSVFPPDIPLGILEPSHSNNGNSLEIRVRLLSDYDRPHNVMVVKNTDRPQIKSLTE